MTNNLYMTHCMHLVKILSYQIDKKNTFKKKNAVRGGQGVVHRLGRERTIAVRQKKPWQYFVV